MLPWPISNKVNTPLVLRPMLLQLVQEQLGHYLMQRPPLLQPFADLNFKVRSQVPSMEILPVVKSTTKLEQCELPVPREAQSPVLAPGRLQAYLPACRRFLGTSGKIVNNRIIQNTAEIDCAIIGITESYGLRCSRCLAFRESLTSRLQKTRRGHRPRSAP